MVSADGPPHQASGSYLSRGLSYREAEFELATVPLTYEQRASFDAAAHFWSDRLLPAVDAAVARTQTAAGRLAQQAWSAHQRFFKQLCVSCKVARALVLNAQHRARPPTCMRMPSTAFVPTDASAQHGV